MDPFWDTLERPFDIYIYIYIYVFGRFSVSPTGRDFSAGTASYRDLWGEDFGTPTDSREESRADLLGAPNLSSRALRGAPNRRSGALRGAPNQSSPRRLCLPTSQPMYIGAAAVPTNIAAHVYRPQPPPSRVELRSDQLNRVELRSDQPNSKKTRKA